MPSRSVDFVRAHGSHANSEFNQRPFCLSSLACAIQMVGSKVPSLRTELCACIDWGGGGVMLGWPGREVEKYFAPNPPKCTPTKCEVLFHPHTRVALCWPATGWHLTGMQSEWAEVVEQQHVLFLPSSPRVVNNKSQIFLAERKR